MRQMITNTISLKSLYIQRLYDIFNEHRRENNVCYPTYPTAIFQNPVNCRLSHNLEAEICEKTTKKKRKNAVK